MDFSATAVRIQAIKQTTKTVLEYSLGYACYCRVF